MKVLNIKRLHYTDTKTCLWQRLNSFVTETKPCKNKTEKSFSNWVSSESLKTATTPEEKPGAELSENGMNEEYETSWR